MPRILLGLAIVVAVAVIYAIVDCALLQKSRIRGVPRLGWIVIIVVLPVIGVILWFTIGRAPLVKLGVRLPPMSPDDDPVFLNEADRLRQDERIRILEEQLAALDDEEYQERTEDNDEDSSDSRKRDDRGNGRSPDSGVGDA